METAFEEAALALTGAVTHAPVAETERIQVDCDAATPDTLLFTWLNAVIYEMSVREMLFSRYEVHVLHGSPLQLNASLWGEHVDRRRHEPACEPKGATLTELRVSQDDRGCWTARCVVDV